MIKTISINILILAIMLIFINIASHFILKLNANKYHQNFDNLSSKTNDKFSEIEKEFNQLQTDYQPFIAWKRKPAKNQFNNIDSSGNRVTIQQNADSEKVIRFFGGSTMWGALVEDSNSIPSLFGKCTNEYRIINNGETGFNSRQNFALFSNLLIQEKQLDVVVFYDGVNDVEHLCRKGISLPGHSREIQMRDALVTVNSTASYFKGKDGILGLSKKLFSKLFFDNTLIVTRKIHGKVFRKPPTNLYCCESDLSKATAVANHLMNTWKIAHQLAKENGIHFIAILQPNVYVGQPKESYLEIEQRIYLEQNFKNVYGILKKEIVNYDWIYDFTEIFDEREDLLYFDFCHLNEEGNEIVANQICKIVEKLNIK
jgi:hypothetical protein